MTIHHNLKDVYLDTTHITDIQRANGALLYRGHAIGDLTGLVYEEVAYLLVYGSLPAPDILAKFRQQLDHWSNLTSSSLELIHRLRSAAPDVALRTVISSLSEPDDAGAVDHLSLIAQIPAIVVAHHALRSNHTVPAANADLDHASDFLTRLMSHPITPIAKRVINLDFILHADHAADTSTFAARIAASTGTDFYASVSAAIGALPGGVAADIGSMLDGLESPKAARRFAKQCMRDNRPPLGFSQQVYSREDPRLALYNQACRDLGKDISDRQLQDKVDALVQEMAPLRKKGIFPTIDLYSTVIYRLLSLPDDLSTVIFSAARSAGWIAHIQEQQMSSMLIRPRLELKRIPSTTLL